MGAFYEVAHNPAIARKDLHWPLHPEYSQGLHKLANGYLTSPWYEKERQRLVVPALIAQELDLSEPMVHKLINEGALKAVRFRRMVRVTDESYQKLLATLESTPKTAA